MTENKRPTLCLGIPTINRKDLLDEALEVYKKTWKNRHIFIVDNGSQNIQENPPYLRAWAKGVNIGVATSWNKIIERQKLLGYSHMMILNDDVIVTKSSFDIEDFTNEERFVL
jgi:GT2 family glycosyltransferase